MKDPWVDQRKRLLTTITSCVTEMRRYVARALLDYPPRGRFWRARVVNSFQLKSVASLMIAASCW